MSTSANSVWNQLAMNPFTYNNRATNPLLSVFLSPSCFWFCGAVPPFLLIWASFSVDVLAFYSCFFFHLLFHAAGTLFPIKACDPTTTKASHGDTGGNLMTEWGTVEGDVITAKRWGKLILRNLQVQTVTFFPKLVFLWTPLSNPHWLLTTHSSRWWTFLSGSSQSTHCFPTLPQLNDASRPHQVKLLLIATLPLALLISAIPSGNLFCRG